MHRVSGNRRDRDGVDLVRISHGAGRLEGSEIMPAILIVPIGGRRQ